LTKKTNYQVFFQIEANFFALSFNQNGSKKEQKQNSTIIAFVFFIPNRVDLNFGICYKGYISKT